MGETTHEAYATAIFRPVELAEAQVGQIWSYLNVAVNSSLNTWIAYEAGLATEDDCEKWCLTPIYTINRDGRCKAGEFR